MVSVGSKRMRKRKKDGWFEHGMNCAEYLELNFGSSPKPKAAPRSDAARQAADVMDGLLSTHARRRCLMKFHSVCIAAPRASSTRVQGSPAGFANNFDGRPIDCSFASTAA
jgi:hypothetical protein